MGQQGLLCKMSWAGVIMEVGWGAAGPNPDSSGAEESQGPRGKANLVPARKCVMNQRAGGWGVGVGGMCVQATLSINWEEWG